MSMGADRDLDAVQRAAFDSDWELATQWLPWSVQARTISDDSKDEKAKSPGPGEDARFDRVPAKVHQTRSTRSASLHVCCR